MGTAWADISSGAFYGDYNAYLRYANQLLKITGIASASSANGMRVFSIEPDKTYRVSMEMRNRFRLCCVPNLTSDQIATNYIIDAADLNDTTDQNGALHTLEITSQAGQLFLCVGAWSSGASETLFNTLNTITVEELRETYSVTFVDWDGTVLKSETVTSGAAATPPDTPTRSGYSFTGWSGSYSNITADTTITAQYIEGILCTVTFTDWDGTVLKTELVSPNSSATPPPSPTREGYNFTGWDGVYENVTSNSTVTASYAVITFSVVFKDWDASIISDQIVNYGSDATPPADPSRNGYLFHGWDGTYTNITTNSVITALYSIDPLTLTGVEVTSLPAKTEYERGSSFDSTGMTVSAIYSVAGSVAISDYILSGFNSSVSGSCTVTVSYGGFSVSFSVTILANTVSEECGSPVLSDVVATIDLDTGALTVKGTGAIKDYPYLVGEPIGVLKNYHDAVTSLTICEGVTVIGQFAFRWCINALSLSLPDGLRIIRGNSFAFWKKLSSVKVPQSVLQISVNAFLLCGALSSVYLHDGLTTIDDGAFESTALTEVIVPNSVTQIGAKAFLNCKQLVSIKLPDTLSSIESNLLAGTESLKSIILPATVKTIKENAFCDCLSLNSLVLPNGVTSVENGAFYNSGLEFFDIPETVTTLGNYVFKNSSRLVTITVPSSLATLSADTFTNCSRLASIIVDKDYGQITGGPWGAPNADVIWNNAILEIGSPKTSDVKATINRITGELVISGIGATIAFTHRPLFEEYFPYLNSVVVEEGITALGAGIFSGCPESAISLPNSLTDIGENAFYRSCFTNLSVPKYAVSIRANAYNGSSITGEIILPDTLSALGESAFDGCSAIAALTTHGTLSEIPSNAFADCTALATVNIGNGVAVISPLAFNGDIAISLIILDYVRDSVAGAPWGATNADIVWIRSPLTVRWLDWDGTLLKTELVTYSEAATPPVVSVRDGYVFSGWDTAYNHILSNCDIKAQYNMKGFFIVEFRDYDESVFKREYVSRNMAATPPVSPSRVGYTFSGWSCDYTVITDDLTVYAQYAARSDEFTVTFKDWNATVLKAESVIYGHSATAPVPPERDGYYFLSWSLSFLHVTSNIVTVAQYRQFKAHLAAEIFSSHTKVGEIRKVTGCSVSRKLNGECTLSLSTLSRLCMFVLPQHKIELNRLIFDIVAIEKRITGGTYQTTITGEHISYTLNNEEYEIDEFDFTGTPEECLGILLSGTPFSVGIVDFTDIVTLKINKADTTRREAVMQLLALCGGEIEYDGYNIGMRSHIGSSLPVRLMETLNVSDVAMSQDIRSGTESYSIELFKHVSLSIGDEVNITFTPLGINTNKRITSIAYNPFNIYSVDVTLGGYKPTLSDALYSISRQTEENIYDTQNLLDKIKTMDKKMDSLADAANKEMPDANSPEALKDIEKDILDIDKKLDELDEYGGIRVESVKALPAIPAANTIYLIQGAVVVE